MISRFANSMLKWTYGADNPVLEQTTRIIISHFPIGTCSHLYVYCLVFFSESHQVHATGLINCSMHQTRYNKLCQVINHVLFVCFIQEWSELCIKWSANTLHYQGLLGCFNFDQQVCFHIYTNNKQRTHPPWGVWTLQGPLGIASYRLGTSHFRLYEFYANKTDRSRREKSSIRTLCNNKNYKIL